MHIRERASRGRAYSITYEAVGSTRPTTESTSSRLRGSEMRLTSWSVARTSAVRVTLPCPSNEFARIDTIDILQPTSVSSRSCPAPCKCKHTNRVTQKMLILHVLAAPRPQPPCRASPPQRSRASAGPPSRTRPSPRSQTRTRRSPRGRTPRSPRGSSTRSSARRAARRCPRR